MIRSYNIEDDRLVECLPTIARVAWFAAPDEDEQGVLIHHHGLDEHTLHSTLDPDEQARIETEPSHRAVIFKVPRNHVPGGDLEFKVTSVGFFLFADLLIVVSADEPAPFSGKPFSRIGRPEEVMLKLINASISLFRTHLQIIARVSEDLSEKISASMENRYLLQLFDLEKSLVYYLNAMSSNSALLEKMRHLGGQMLRSPEDREFLDDIIIENYQCFKQARMYSNILSSMTAARASIVSNNLNILMKRLNIVTIGIMIPTLVVSTFSMNVAIPLQKNEYAFWIILGLSVISLIGVLGVWRYFRRDPL